MRPLSSPIRSAALTACAALLSTMAAAVPAHAAPVPPPTLPNGISTNKVLVVGMDGLRHDRIEASIAPNLTSLMASGSFGTSLLYTQPMAATSSGPGWSTIATGTWPDKHGVKDNTFSGKRYDLHPDFLTRLEQANPAFSTYAAVDWAPLGNQGTFSSAIDGRVILDGDAAGYPAEDARITEVSTQVLRDQNPDVAFVYLGNIDIAGHNSGAASTAYREAIRTSDAQLGQLIAAVKARPTYASERWTIMVATDHGHTDSGGHGGASIEERRTFVLASGPGIPAGSRPKDTRLVDVAATVLDRLGVAAPATADGRPVDRRTADAFESVTLGSRVDETSIPTSVLGFTHTAPAGWGVDISALPSGGMTEWRGWSFTTDEFWSRAQSSQWRELFVRGRGVFAVADSDEWDDKSHGSGTYDSTLTTPAFPVTGGTTTTLRYTTHYRQEGNQKAQVLVSFNGGAATVVKSYTADAVAKVEAIPVTVPAGATSMTVRFRYFDASNNWYWAIDDVKIG